MPATNQQAIAALSAILDAITEAVNSSPNGLPSGHLYASLMGKMTLDQYNQIIGALIRAGRIKQNANFLLTAA